MLKDLLLSSSCFDSSAMRRAQPCAVPLPGGENSRNSAFTDLRPILKLCCSAYESVVVLSRRWRTHGGFAGLHLTKLGRWMKYPYSYNRRGHVTEITHWASKWGRSQCHLTVLHVFTFWLLHLEMVRRRFYAGLIYRFPKSKGISKSAHRI